MMWLIFRLRKEFEKIKQSFKKRDESFKELKENVISKDMIELMISNEILKVRNELHEQTPRTSRTPNTYHKKAHKLADKMTLVNEIKELIKQDLSTNEMYLEIVENKGLCGKTCFYKYLKKVRKLASRSPRTITTN